MSSGANDTRTGLQSLSVATGARWRDLFSGDAALRMAVLAGGIALHSISLYITTSILPTVVANIGGMPLYAWNTTVFVVAAIVGAAVAVQVLQRTGPCLAYIVAGVSFAAGSAACALAPSMHVMLLGRLLQGLAGGLLLALPYVLVQQTLPQPLWPRALALFSGMWGVATLLGPAVGGALAQYASWRLAFGALIPVALLLSIGAGLVFRGMKFEAAATAPPIHQLALLVAAALAASSSTLASSASAGLLGLVGALALLVVMGRRDRSASTSLLPRAAYGRASALGSLYLVSALMAITVTCTELFIPLFLQRNQGYSPLAAGYIAAAASAGWTIGALSSASMTPDFAHRFARSSPWLCALALALLCFTMSQPSAAPSFGFTLTIALALIVLGLGVGLAWPQLANTILNVAPPSEADLASGAIMTVQLIATTMSAAAGGYLIGLTTKTDATDLTAPAAWLFGLLILAPVTAVVLWAEDKSLSA
ncbi:MFS transporter [Hylemonella sp. W303a]|uniref:MFS transporter n=1 Tax=Hylemonella sp. W303a TaxID=3389873 RepID=UPI00396B26E5